MCLASPCRRFDQCFEYETATRFIALYFVEFCFSYLAAQRTTFHGVWSILVLMFYVLESFGVIWPFMFIHTYWRAKALIASRRGFLNRTNGRRILLPRWQNHQNIPPCLMHIQVKDREAYYIDLQLLRVTKKLQAVLKGDRGEKDKELVQKTEARVEMMERSHESKVRVPTFRTSERTTWPLTMCPVKPQKGLQAIAV